MPMTQNTITALFAIFLGIAYLIGTVFMADAMSSYEISPRLFPYIIGTATICSGIALLFLEIKKGNREVFSFNFVKEKHIWLKILLLSILGCLYGQFLDSAGYVITTAFFMVGCLSVLNRGHHRTNLILAGVFSVLTYVIFAMGLELSLPRGLLGFLPF